MNWLLVNGGETIREGASRHEIVPKPNCRTSLPTPVLPFPTIAKSLRNQDASQNPFVAPEKTQAKYIFSKCEVKLKLVYGLKLRWQ